uniref:Protein kinase domain-containing protein n=1 Tax=Pseudo-nitzschia australis TaxID=44445 RepID=A0A6U9XWE5_9STRA
MSTITNKEHHQYRYHTNHQSTQSIHHKKNSHYNNNNSKFRCRKPQQHQPQQQYNQRHNKHHNYEHKREAEDPTAPLIDTPESSASSAGTMEASSNPFSLSSLSCTSPIVAFVGTGSTGSTCGTSINTGSNKQQKILKQQQTATAARTSTAAATSTTGTLLPPPISGSFFKGATFGIVDAVTTSATSSAATTTGSTERERHEKSERVLKFARKRLKKSHVEDYYNYQCRKGRERRSNSNTSTASNTNNTILDVCHSDVQLDSILGNGSYNVVYSVKSINVRTTTNKGRITEQSSQSCQSQSRQSSQFIDPSTVVIKTLRSKLLNDLPMLAACAADLRKEGLVLAALQQHSNDDGNDNNGNDGNNNIDTYNSDNGSRHVLKVLAWTHTGLSAFANGCHDSYFIVLEKLERTLSDTLKEWKALEESQKHQQGEQYGQYRQYREQNGQQRQLRQQQPPPTANSNYRHPNSSNNNRRSQLLVSVKDSLFRKQKSISKAFSQLQQKQKQKCRQPKQKQKRLRPSLLLSKMSKLPYSSYRPCEDDEHEQQYEHEQQHQYEQQQQNQQQQQHKRNNHHCRNSGSNRTNVNSNSNNNTSYRQEDQDIRFWTMRLGLLVDLCSAVAFMHSQKVVHRDLKPDNVGFDKSGTLKVFDFDVARVLPPHVEEKDRLFRLTKKVGSPRYMSPEVARGQPYNEKTDVFAVGLLAYEVLNLKRPFETVPNNNCSGNNNNNKNNRAGNGDYDTEIYKYCVPVVIQRTTAPRTRTNTGATSTKEQHRKQSFLSGDGVERFIHRIRNKDLRVSTSTNSNTSATSAAANRNHNTHQTESKNNSNDQQQREPKYANLRPLLPILTRQELQYQQHQHQQLYEQQQRAQSFQTSSSIRTSPSTMTTTTTPTTATITAITASRWPRKLHNQSKNNFFGMAKLSNKMFGSSTSRSFTNSTGSGTSNTNTSNKNCNSNGSSKHNINDVDFETHSFFWTRSLRTVIDRSWSYDIPTRPSASALKNALRDEVDRIHNALIHNNTNNSNNRSGNNNKSSNYCGYDSSTTEEPSGHFVDEDLRDDFDETKNIYKYKLH